MRADNFIRQRVAKIDAYHVEPHPCEVVLDANESPYPLPEKLREKVNAAIARVEFNRYPDPQASALRKAIAGKEGVEVSEILPGNGSDELIQLLIAVVCDPGDCILTPTPTFSMYRLIAQYLNVNTVDAPLNADWSVDLELTLRNIKYAKPKIVFLASPNNPTGAIVPRYVLEAICNAAPGVVVVDEAYADFSSAPLEPLFRERPNVVILRTLSKIGFAAARLGYMMADGALIDGANKARLPYNINSLTQAAATEVINNWGGLAGVFGLIARERGRVFGELSAFDGVTAFPSEANFLLMRVHEKVEKVFLSLLKKSVRVRWFKGDKRLGDCFRVTTGTPEENDRFLEALKSSL